MNIQHPLQRSRTYHYSNQLQELFTLVKSICNITALCIFSLKSDEKVLPNLVIAHQKFSLILYTQVFPSWVE